MVWYLTLYSRQPDGGCRLLHYEEYTAYDVAHSSFRRKMPEFDTDFWHLECHLGSLDTTPVNKYCYRTKFANNEQKAKLQMEAERKAKELLKLIRNLHKANDKLKTAQYIAMEMTMIKPCLTERQYAIIINELERQPFIRKLVSANEL